MRFSRLSASFYTSGRRVVFAAFGISAMLGSTVVAHHSAGRRYDNTRTVEVDGIVSKLLLKNPHSMLYVEARAGVNGTIQWEIELGPPPQLTRSGLRPDVLRPGTRVKVVGQPARAAGSHSMCCAGITRPDGTPLAGAP
jgi:hypothetical protein